MMDSTWVTPMATCCGSSGMPQMVIRCEGRGMAAVLQQAAGELQADAEHAENEDAAERLCRQPPPRVLADPYAHHGRRHGGDAGHACGQVIGAVQRERHGEHAGDEYEHDAERLDQFVAVHVE